MERIKPNKTFWTIDVNGSYVERDLAWEHYNWFDRERGNYDESKIADTYNMMYYEIFDMSSFDSDGCDYERYGCQIRPGDVVADIGANIGLFSHRAELKGASKVYSFEPMGTTYMALYLNSGDRTKAFKNSIYSDQRIMKMVIPEMKSNTGGGIVKEKLDNMGRMSIIEENVVSLDINSLFNPSMIGKIDFMKMDIEGSELECLKSITDENLSSLRCLAIEFHLNLPGMSEFKDSFIDRCRSLGFNTFAHYYQDGLQMTLNVWKP